LPVRPSVRLLRTAPNFKAENSWKNQNRCERSPRQG